MIDNIGKFMDENELTLEEEVYYANYGEIELCDMCHDYCCIFNHNDDTRFVEYNGIQFLCNKCRS